MKNIHQAEKPTDWPLNQYEQNIDYILNLVEKFYTKPSYTLKETLFSFIDQTDLNEINEFGIIRHTDYEVAVLNELYLKALSMNCESLKIYIYAYLNRQIRLNNMLYKMNDLLESLQAETNEYFIKSYFSLIPPLKLYFVCFTQFSFLKNRNLTDTLINTTKKLLDTDNPDLYEEITHSFVVMFKDLSYFTSTKTCGIFAFERNELLKLFEFEANLLKKTNQNIAEHPLRGVIKLTLKNWILKSRNNYNDSYLFKCISSKSTLCALNNNEIWMNKIENLNDKRERKVIKEIYKNKTWVKYSWAKNVNLNFETDSYVCSYSKVMPDDRMKNKYGHNIFGYKSDRIADILTPISIFNGHPFFELVSCYDIIYGQEEAKNEINYLCDIIDLFDLSDKDKNYFLSDILEYWLLSIKDNKWDYECERRFQIFMGDDAKFIDTTVSEKYFKTKCTLYTYPDFLISDNSYIKFKVQVNRKDKLNFVAQKNYVYCLNCLQADFDSVSTYSNKSKCSICGSTNIKFIDIFKK